MIDIGVMHTLLAECRKIKTASRQCRKKESYCRMKIGGK